jgi:hypothetical protein
MTPSTHTPTQKWVGAFGGEEDTRFHEELGVGSWKWIAMKLALQPKKLMMMRYFYSLFFTPNSQLPTFYFGK